MLRWSGQKSNVLLMLYLDIGVLSYFAKFQDVLEQYSDPKLGFAYSEFTLKELRRSPGPKDREFGFLKSIDAYLIAELDGKELGFYKADPEQHANGLDDLTERLVGGMFSRLVGGGEDIAEDTFLVELVSQIPLMTSEVARLLVKKNSAANDDHLKYAFARSFQTTPRMEAEETLRDFINRQDKPAQDVLSKLFAEKLANTLVERATACLMLNFIQHKPAKGIAGIKKRPSENEVFDALHVACALECKAFLTTDKSTSKKFRILSEFWNTGAECFLITKAPRRTSI